MRFALNGDFFGLRRLRFSLDTADRTVAGELVDSGGPPSGTSRRARPLLALLELVGDFRPLDGTALRPRRGGEARPGMAASALELASSSHFPAVGERVGVTVALSSTCADVSS